MTLSEIATQAFNAAVNGQINGEKFSKTRLKNQFSKMLRNPGDQYIFEITLPDGNWFAKVSRGYRGYGLTIPETRDEEERLAHELFKH